METVLIPRTFVVKKQFFARGVCGTCGMEFCGEGCSKCEAEGDLDVQLKNHWAHCKPDYSRKGRSRN